MKTRNFFFLSLFIIISGLLVVNACKKDDDDDDDTSLASDNAIMQSTFDQPQSMADQAATYGNLQTFIATTGDVNLLGSCATITHDSVSTPRILTIDFGTTNCLCYDGRYRRGKIIVSYTGRYRDSGTVITFAFNNYAVNDYVVTNNSTKVVTNKGKKTNGHPLFSIHESGSILKPNNGGTIIWLSDREREWIAGYNTWKWSDDEYLITGTASGITAKSLSYTMTITTPLHIMLDCHWITAGVIDITPFGSDTYTLDYGNGSCDNQATVKYRKKTYNITLN
jgi:hypothetical protein